MRLALLLIILTFGVPTGLAAGADEAPARPGFVAAALPLYAVPGSGERPIGKLLVAAPLRRVGAPEAGWQRVLLSGWAQEGAERVLQAAPGLRVTRAALAKSGLAALTFGAARTDPDTGQRWTRATLTGWIAADATLSPDIETLWSRAEALFATRCTACHVRRVPSHYTANQWTSYLKVMGPRTGLPDEDQDLIRVFLQYHSADAAALAQALRED